MERMTNQPSDVGVVRSPMWCEAAALAPLAGPANSNPAGKPMAGPNRITEISELCATAMSVQSLIRLLKDHIEILEEHG